MLFLCVQTNLVYPWGTHRFCKNGSNSSLESMTVTRVKSFCEKRDSSRVTIFSTWLESSPSHQKLWHESSRIIDSSHTSTVNKLGKSYASIQTAIPLKLNTLETNVLRKKCLWRTYLCSDDHKSWIFLVGVQEGKNHAFWGYFGVQATFLPASIHQPHQTCRKDVFWCLTKRHQISSQNIDRKILFVKNSKKSIRLPSSFQGLFLAITPQSLRLAGTQGL